METGAVSQKTQIPQTISTSQAEKQGESPKFKDVWEEIQTKYGAKPKPPREIKKTLDKDDFLRIMVTQMKHQDPTKPFDADKLGSEIAQITSVEQLANVNQALKQLSNQNKPLERFSMTNLIGKNVTVDMNRFNYQEGQNQTVSFMLPRKAEKVKVSLIGVGGETVYEKELGSQEQGQVSFAWDGKQKSGVPVKSGTYMVSVIAEDENGVPVKTEMMGKARIIGVSFEGQEPVFLVGDSKNQSRITMGNIIQIESNELELPKNNIVTSKDKEPSKAMLESLNAQKESEREQELKANPELAAEEAAKKIMQPTAQAPGFQQMKQSAPVLPIDSEKGFPNGLSTAASEQEENNNVAMKGGESK